MLKFIVLFFLFFQTVFAQGILIGKYDRLDLLDLNLKNIRAKIDTGAKTSSLHCSSIEKTHDNNVIFEVLDDSHKKYKNKKYKMPILREAKIKSSNGQVEKRYIISSKVKIFDKVFDVEFSLRNRKKMNYPILLGREFLQQGFIVDVNKENLSFNSKLIKQSVN